LGGVVGAGLGVAAGGVVGGGVVAGAVVTAGAVDGEAVLEAASALPQDRQNFALSAFSALHFGHTLAMPGTPLDYCCCPNDDHKPRHVKHVGPLWLIIRSRRAAPRIENAAQG
jgi:hypothetical protein